MRILLAVVLVVLQAACESGPPAPVEPVWGKQACGHCMMLVSEKPPSAQALLADGSRFFFDDVGCMAAWTQREQADAKALWVRGPGGNGWVDARTATFSAGNVTPMDFGYLADSKGVRWEDVLAGVVAKTNKRNGGPQ